MAEIELQTNPTLAKQVKSQDTQERLKKQIKRCETIEGLSKAVMAFTIASAAIGEAIIGFEGAAVAAMGVGAVCVPLIVTDFIAKRRMSKLENRLDNVKKANVGVMQKIINDRNQRNG